MQVFIHIGTNLEYFKLLNEGFLLSMGKQDREIANFIMENYPGELAQTISPQYEVNFVAIREIKKKLGQDVFNKIDGIYYGSDNCEYLIPYKKEIEKAIEKFREFNKNFPPHKIRTFSLVTPYFGDTMLEKLEEGLEYLNNLNIKNPIEVVVNDFGVLNLLTKKYTNLKISFGRLIHKLLKTPLIDTYGYEVHPAGELIKNKTEKEINILRQEIIKWQLKFYNSAEVSLDLYQNFLKKYKIKRVALDFMQNREELYRDKGEGARDKGQEECEEKGQNNFPLIKGGRGILKTGNGQLSTNNSIGIDLYYPWALVFTGRLCDTSAINNPSRGFYAIDEICGRDCNKFDIHYNVKTVGYNLTQRGNAGFRSELNLENLPESFVKNDNNRLIFAPFISV